MRINQRIEPKTALRKDGKSKKRKETSLPPPNKTIANLIFDRIWEINPILSLTSQMASLTGLRYSDASWLRYDDFYDENENFLEQFNVCQQKPYRMRISRMKQPSESDEAEAFRKSLVVVYTTPEIQEIVEQTRLFTDGGGYLFSNARSRKVVSGEVVYRPMSVSSADNHHKLVRQKLEREGVVVRGLATHSWRKFFALMLDEAGTPLKNIRDLLGHSSIDITDKYLHSFKGELQKNVQSLSLESNKYE
ncbi:tyrosine-type recombinase/integrase [Vibrio sp. 10N.222.54.A1]|uniref:tyrosine-type recombinase/integrase n=1 Tax=unclassified Vibrio TaxID=2614977 RepID=UPI00354B9A38